MAFQQNVISTIFSFFKKGDNVPNEVKKELKDIASSADEAAKSQDKVADSAKNSTASLSKLASGISLVNPTLGGYIQGASRMASATTAIADVMKTLGSTISSVAKSLWAFVTTPIGAAITAIAAVIGAVVAWTQHNEEVRKSNLENAESIDEVCRYAKTEEEAISNVNRVLDEQNKKIEEQNKLKKDQIDLYRKWEKTAEDLQIAELEASKKGLLPEQQKEIDKKIEQLKNQKAMNDAIYAQKTAEENVNAALQKRQKILDSIKDIYSQIAEKNNKINAIRDEVNVDAKGRGLPEMSSVEHLPSVQAIREQIAAIAVALKALTDKIPGLDLDVNKAKAEADVKAQNIKILKMQQGEGSPELQEAKDKLEAYKRQEIEYEDERIAYMVKYNREMEGYDKIQFEYKKAINKAWQNYWQAIISGAKTEEDANADRMNQIDEAQFKRNSALKKMAEDAAKTNKLNMLQAKIDKLAYDEYEAQKAYLEDKIASNGKMSKEDEARYQYQKAMRDAEKRYYEDLKSGMEEQKAKRNREIAELNAQLAFNEATSPDKSSPTAYKTFDSNSIQAKGGFAQRTDIARSGLYNIDYQKQQFEAIQEQLKQMIKLNTTVEQINMKELAGSWS